MRKVKAVIEKIYHTKVTPYAIIVIAFIFAASVSFTLSPQSPLFKSNITEKTIATVQETKPSENETIDITPLPSPTDKPSNTVLGVKTTNGSPTPKSTLVKQSPTPTQINNQTGSSSPNTQNNSSTQTQVNANNQESPQATPVPQAQSPSPSPTPTIVNTVNVEIKTPDSPSSFSVELKEGMNVCDVLQKAKDDGKISSLTFDDSYLSTFNSRYVYEINGYKKSLVQNSLGIDLTIK